MSLSKKDCDICYENGIVKELKCCKGKKWCARCEEKVKDKCPFCRHIFPRPVIIHEDIRRPRSVSRSPRRQRRNAVFSRDPVPYNSYSLGFGQQVSANIPRNGDLVNNMYLQIRLPQVVEQPTMQPPLEDIDEIFQRLEAEPEEPRPSRISSWLRSFASAFTGLTSSPSGRI
jgi:hypothetical protein